MKIRRYSLSDKCAKENDSVDLCDRKTKTYQYFHRV